jgi:hypothetical protein
MKFSPYPYMAIVFFVIAVNVWLMVRFLLKAQHWGKEKSDPKNN